MHVSHWPRPPLRHQSAATSGILTLEVYVVTGSVAGRAPPDQRRRRPLSESSPYSTTASVGATQTECTNLAFEVNRR